MFKYPCNLIKFDWNIIIVSPQYGTARRRLLAALSLNDLNELNSALGDFQDIVKKEGKLDDEIDLINVGEEAKKQLENRRFSIVMNYRLLNVESVCK